VSTRLPDGAFLMAHATIAGLVAVMWTIEDATGSVGGLVRQHYGLLLLAAQAAGLAAGVWQGRSGTGGRVRMLLCSACPVALMAWWFLGAGGLERVLVLLPAGAGTAFFLGPALAGVAAGAMLRRNRLERALARSSYRATPGERMGRY